jgi:S1-C subfamily serine protease
MHSTRFITVLVALAALLTACQTTPVVTDLPDPAVTSTQEPAPTVTFAIEPFTDLSQLYAQVSPGVVSIVIYVDEGPHSDSVPVGQGSGFVYDLQGHIVTNQHVIDGASAIEVDFPSGLKAWAEVIGSDPNSDLAVIQVTVSPEQLHPLALGQANDLQIGDQVVAIGNPFGLTGTMTVGVVSALDRVLDSINTTPEGGVFSAGDLIQTDAAINPGNSGGPLLNLQGEVVGVNRAIRTEAFTVSGEAANSGVGFAIPVGIVGRVVPELIETGQYQAPYLGISTLDESFWNLRTLEALGLPPDAMGAYITVVASDSPASQAGLIGGDRPTSIPSLLAGGDLIVAIDGIQVQTFSELLSYILTQTEVNQTVVLTVVRDGEEQDIDLIIGARP